MKRIATLFLSLLFVSNMIYAQSLTVTFTGRTSGLDGDVYIPLTKIVVHNITQKWEHTLYFPDTVMKLGITGLENFEKENEFQLSQNVPNPFDGTTDVSLQLPEAGKVFIEIYDLMGKKIMESKKMLPSGVHTFRVMLSSPQGYLLKAQCGDYSSSIKMVNNGCAGDNAIHYLGIGNFPNTILGLKNGSKGQINKPFLCGDEMDYVGYAIIDGEEVEGGHVVQQQIAPQEIVLFFERQIVPDPKVSTRPISFVTENSAVSGGNVTEYAWDYVWEGGVCWSTSPAPTVEDSHIVYEHPDENFVCQLTDLTPQTQYYVRAFITNQNGISYGDERSFVTMAETSDGKPCELTPTLMDYDSNVYNTVQIGKQCWMKENLRTTHFADGTAIQRINGTSTSVAALYEPMYEASNVPIYGYLYNAVAYMHGASASSSNPSGVQGICPKGWHLPSDAEWIQMFQYVGSNEYYQCGGDSANIIKALASPIGWVNNYGFSNECYPTINPQFNNVTGFSAVPSGIYYGKCFGFGDYAFYTSTTKQDGYFLGYYLNNSQPQKDSHVQISDAVTVRCLRD